MAEVYSKSKYNDTFNVISEKNFPDIIAVADKSKHKVDETELMKAINALEGEYANGIKLSALAEYDSKKYSVDMPTDDDLVLNAAEIVNPKYDNAAAKKENDYSYKLSKVESDILSAGKLGADKEKALNESYYYKQKALAEQIARGGLSYSSISELSGESLNRSKEEGLQSIRSKIAEDTEKLERQIESMQREYEIALEGYEIARAADIKKMTAELKKQAQKQSDEAEIINAQIEKEKQAYLAGFYDMLAQKENEDAQKGYYEGAKKDNYEARYELAKEFYSSLHKETASALISQNNELKAKLGIYYDKLLKVLE